MQGAEDAQRRSERHRAHRWRERSEKQRRGRGKIRGRRGPTLVVRVAAEARPLRQLCLQNHNPRKRAVPRLRSRTRQPVAERVPRGGRVGRVQEICRWELAEAEGAREFLFFFFREFFLFSPIETKRKERSSRFVPNLPLFVRTASPSLRSSVSRLRKLSRSSRESSSSARGKRRERKKAATRAAARATLLARPRRTISEAWRGKPTSWRSR